MIIVLAIRFIVQWVALWFMIRARLTLVCMVVHHKALKTKRDTRFLVKATLQEV